MNEEILNGVTMGPDHEKKDGPSRVVACLVLLALLTACACAAGALGFLAALGWSK